MGSDEFAMYGTDMSTNKQDTIDYASMLPLSGLQDTNGWSVRGLPPVLKRGLFALAALGLVERAT